MNLVTLAKFNELRFAADPIPMVKLWRWCRDNKLPARKIGGEWRIDLDAFDAVPAAVGAGMTAQMVIAKLRAV